ncbi:hypothetical protein ARMSODRAFT_1088800 [Armillaria solidipes]|uniref:DUF6534 domain-containing protein n=1 Tax=Armillaria solidipes TaxID=1076256 RepID=A0A2H3BGP0_9AGAR|nr:hypothetical protein ARMSODRAFT_1088800 [Armillaria solidipes]
MSSQPSIALPSVGDTFGACYIGSIIAAILYGVSTLQVVIYYKRYPNDWWVYRYSVTLLWALDTFQVALSTHALYFYLITMFGDLIGDLESDLWSMKLQLTLNNFLAVLYAIRLWKLGRYFHKILPCFVFLAVATSLSNNIVLARAYAESVVFRHYDMQIWPMKCKRTFKTGPGPPGITLDSHTVPNLLSVSIIKKSMYIFFATIEAADLIIVPMMCYYLHKSRRNTMFSTTAARLLRLMRLVLISGLATCVLSLIIIIAYVVWPDSLIFVGFHFILSKSYINSLLAMFNSRSVEQLNNRATERGVKALPAVLQMTPHRSEGNADDTNKAGIPLRHISSFKDKMDLSRGPLDVQV